MIDNNQKMPVKALKAFYDGLIQVIVDSVIDEIIKDLTAGNGE